MPRPYLEYVCWIVSLLGMLSILWSAYRWHRAAPIAMGRVRCIEKRYSIDGASYAPIVEFDWHGERITLENLPRSPWRPKVKTGERVPLYFSPSAPTSAKLTPISLPLVGLSLFAVALSIAMQFFLAM